MLMGIKRNVVIQPGGIIEIKSDELPAGTNAEVIVILENEKKQDNFSFLDLIGSGKGCFRNSEETDLFIRKERDSWI
jgi:hypothetical protein